MNYKLMQETTTPSGKGITGHMDTFKEADAKCNLIERTRELVGNWEGIREVEFFVAFSSVAEAHTVITRTEGTIIKHYLQPVDTRNTRDTSL